MNGHSNIDTLEATEHLKNILNVGKSESSSGMIRAMSNGSMEGMGEKPLIHDLCQRIDLCCNEDSSHVAIYGTDVDIYSSPMHSDSTCSQVLMETIIAYGWEEKYYQGRLISIHLSGMYLAFVLKSPQKAGGFVRILCPQLETRHLIKDYKHEVKDISFAHTLSQVLLGSVDACGELLVHKIGDNGVNITCHLLLRILRPGDWIPSDHNHVIWCLYIPDENAEEENPNEDASSLLVVTHNERAEIWNIESVLKEHGFGSLTIEEVKYGAQIITDQIVPITSATFSPDGTALAIGNMKGAVNFFQVNNIEKNESPKCIHEWMPHPGKSLSSLFFLDNCKNHRPDVQLWKYAVTGSENNTELKVWNCQTWQCSQTIRIHSNPNDSIMPCLKAEIDLSCQCLFLSDIKRKVLLILNLQQEPMQSNTIINSLSEYSLPFSVLSLAISHISSVKLDSLVGCKNSEDEVDRDHLDSADGQENFYQYKIKLFWIQTKSLQSCNIIYKPTVTSPLISVGSAKSLSQESFVFKDGMSDVSADGHDASSRSSKDLDMSLTKTICDDLVQPNHSALSTLSPHISSYSDVLLTPDDFTSPSHTTIQSSFHLHEGTASKSSGDPIGLESSSFHRRKSSQHSAASSPSREVAEILAPTKVLRRDEMVSEVSTIKDDDETTSIIASRSPTSSRNEQEFLKDWPQAPDPSKDFKLSGNPELSEIKGKLSQMSEQNVELTQKLESLQRNIENEISLLRQEYTVFSQSIGDILKNIETVMTQNAERQRQRTDEELHALPHRISVNFREEVQTTFKQELDATFVPQTNKSLEAIAQKLHTDLNQKFAAADSTIRESVIKHLSRKTFIDSLTQSLSPSIQTINHSVCRDVFQNSVIPSFDKCCNHLFEQLKEQFNKGTLEYIHKLESIGQEARTSLDTQVCKIKDEVQALTKCAQALKVENNLDLVNQRDLLLSEMRQAVQEETRKALREQTSVVLSSRTSTPVQFNDPQTTKQQLMHLIREGNLGSAFQQALSAMDVQLVLFVCENVSPDQVFGPSPCPLQQHVLLSLVNQLSCDLSVKTEIKLRYIEDVIANLDNDSPVVKEHRRSVLENLHRRVVLFQQNNPNHALSRNMKRIIMVIKSLLV